MKVTYDKCGRMNYNPELHFNQGESWSDEELEYLMNWYDIIGMEEMSLALGRTEKSVAGKVHELKKKGLMSKEKRCYTIRLLRLEDSKTILTY